MIKKIILSLLILINILYINVKAEDSYFVLVDSANDESVILDEFLSYSDALSFFNREKGNYSNLSIKYNDIYYMVEYGVVLFKNNQNCDYLVEFNNENDDKSNYLNACYGADGAYISTNNSASKVLFKISGVRGYANFDDVSIYPIDKINQRFTNYKVIDNHLYHQIKQSFDTDYYGALINLGISPYSLDEGKEYFSYDGNYFYEDMRVMLDDYKNNTYSNSINFDNPYYNYYLYLNHRSITSYDEADLNNYLEDKLFINDRINYFIDNNYNSINDVVNKSQYFKQLYPFFEYQYIYGANALMSLSLSNNETAFGRSRLSYLKNNLFGHSAFDNETEKNASRYSNVLSSVYSHDKYYIDNSYCNPNKFQYHGCFFGNKNSGMNVSYASDPYWGEKAAQNYFKIDEDFGFKDNNKYTVGIITKKKLVNIYEQASTSSNILYDNDYLLDYSFIILGEKDDFYIIQSDKKLEDREYYDFDSDIGYVEKNLVDYIIYGNNEKTNKFNIEFDAGDGTFRNNEKIISYRLEEGKIPSIEKPKLDGYSFYDWDKDLLRASEDAKYSAIYKKISSVELVEPKKKEYYINDFLDIRGGSIRVEYDDNTSLERSISSDDIVSYNLGEAGKQSVVLNIDGIEKNYEVLVKENLSKNIDINNITKEEIDLYGLSNVSWDNLKEIDKKFMDESNDSYIIKKNEYDLSVSGLATFIKKEDKFLGLFNNQYDVKIDNSYNNDEVNSLSDFLLAEDYNIYDKFKIKIRKNIFFDVNLNGNVIFQIKKPESRISEIFKVYRFDGKDIVECSSRQSKSYIEFKSDKEGTFIVVTKNTTNNYDIEDSIQNLNYNNSDTNYYMYAGFFILALIGGIIFVIYKNKKQKNKI